MPRNGAGNYSLVSGNPVTTGTTISSTTHNNTLADIASALTDSLAKDGQTTPTADLPMGTYKHTDVADATARTQYAKVSQIQDGGYVTLSSVSGADTITATCSPAITAYAAGQFFTFVAAGANTGAVTLNINSLGAKAVTKEGTTALAAGEIASGAVVCVEYDGTRFQIVGGRSVQPLDATLTALAGTLTAANKIPYATALNTAGELTLSTSTSLGTSDTTLSSQKAVKSYVDTEIAAIALLTAGTAVASTSGTAIDFTGIPAGTKRITVSFDGVSTNGTSNLLIRLGDAGGFETTGYLSVVAVVAGDPTYGAIADTTGFVCAGAAAAYLYGGSITLSLLDGFTWVVSGNLSAGAATRAFMSAGSKTLTAELTQIRITTANGTDAFDAGSINILYE